MRQAGTDPEVLVHLGQREDTRQMITLELTNVGAGAARNVKVEVLKPEALDGAAEKIVTNIRQINTAIRVIPQDKSVSYNFGLGHDLVNEPVLPSFDVRVSYEDIDGAYYASVQSIDVRELLLQRADTPIPTQIRDELKNLSKAIDKLGREIGKKT